MSKGIAQQLRDYIRRDGRSLHALGKAADVDRTVLWRFMKGERTITIETAGPICDALGLELRPKRKKRR